jgi:hypothetical protein
MDEPVPDLIGQVSAAKQWLVALAAALAGTGFGAVLGAWLWTAFQPKHGCGDIGCWDFVAGAFFGAVVGLVGAPIAAVTWLRRRARAR